MAHTHGSLVGGASAGASRPWYLAWWLAISQPTSSNFRLLIDDPGIDFGRTLTWVLGAGFAAALISWEVWPGFLRASYVTGDVTWSPGIDVFPLIGIPAYLIELGILHLSARVLGGRGSASGAAYLLASYTCPLILLVGLISGLENQSLGGLALTMPYGLNPVSGVYGFTLAGLLVRGLILLLRAGLDVVTVRAAYGLAGWRAALPALIVVAAGIVAVMCALVPVPVM